MANITTFTSENQPIKKGRKKGVKNRNNQEIRNFIQLIINNNLEKLEDDLNTLSPFNRLNMMEKLLKYVLPVLTKNDNINENKDVKIVVEYVDYSKKED